MSVSGGARTNFVLIANRRQLMLDLLPFGDRIRVIDHPDAKGFMAFEGADGPEGQFPTMGTDATGKPVAFDPTTQIARHMAPRHVLVLLAAAIVPQIEADEDAPGVRGVVGIAIAYSQDGRYTCLRLHDIYARAAEAFGMQDIEIGRASFNHLPAPIRVALEANNQTTSTTEYDRPRER